MNKNDFWLMSRLHKALFFEAPERYKTALFRDRKKPAGSGLGCEYNATGYAPSLFSESMLCPISVFLNLKRRRAIALLLKGRSGYR